ncbi:hypothetical protein BDV30DRAFT_213379 [Aspergillus minisclerotigenes]|uniref:Uncharacterized protein n=1 Tax=Aspergillus minisclerotigenes TaxID=656917 RepID=A0A5N6J019_9EURO|nr:hypothetical protein BDV30DRAFT_213379 [Aspergillus minisclerotigenes]
MISLKAKLYKDPFFSPVTIKKNEQGINLLGNKRHNQFVEKRRDVFPQGQPSSINRHDGPRSDNYY